MKKSYAIAASSVLALATGSFAAAPSEFAEAMTDAMARMHAAMMVAPTSSADHDFARCCQTNSHKSPINGTVSLRGALS